MVVLRRYSGRAMADGDAFACELQRAQDEVAHVRSENARLHREKHLIPLPHISASDPSRFHIRPHRSAVSDGDRRIRPSEPSRRRGERHRYCSVVRQELWTTLGPGETYLGFPFGLVSVEILKRLLPCSHHEATPISRNDIFEDSRSLGKWHIGEARTFHRRRDGHNKPLPQELSRATKGLEGWSLFTDFQASDLTLTDTQLSS